MKQKQLTMRALCGLLLLGIVSAIMLSSCSNLTSEEKRIVGKYYVSETEEIEATDEDPEMTLSTECEQEYKKNRTLNIDGTLKVLVVIEDYDYYNVITVEYRLRATGTWQLKGNEIIEKGDPKSVQFKFVRSTLAYNDEIGQSAVEIMKQHMDANIPKLKKEASKSFTSEIISINDHEMILMDTEDDTETTYIKIK